MLNYYELFGVSPSATTIEIKKIIHQQMRLWSHRTNAPQIERRQEAERMVRVLEEMEEILLDEEKREAYDAELRKVIAAEQETVSQSSLVDRTYADETTATVEKSEPKLTLEQIDKQLAEGEAYFEQGDYYQALNIAKKLSTEVTDRAQIWALLGRSRFKIGELHEAISPLVKASDLDSKNASYVYDLGLVFEQQENQVRALEQFKLAYTLESENLAYKFKLGVLLLSMNNLQESVPLLEQCYHAAPEHPAYQDELAKAYLQAAVSKWKIVHADNPYIEPGRYPIDKADLKTVETYLQRVERIPFTDGKIRQHLNMQKEELHQKKGRQFTGSWLMVVLSTIFLIITQVINPSAINMALIGLPILYIISAYTPKYRLYRKAFKMKSPKTDFAHMFVSLKNRFGTVGAWLISLVLLAGYFFITAFVLSIVIIYNFIRNFF